MRTELGCASANSDIFFSIQQVGSEKSGFKFLPPDLIFFTLTTPFEKIIYILPNLAKVLLVFTLRMILHVIRWVLIGIFSPGLLNPNKF
jgi:hypothetical protein